MRHIVRWLLFNPWMIPLTILAIVFAWCIGDDEDVETYVDVLFDELILGRKSQ